MKKLIIIIFLFSFTFSFAQTKDKVNKYESKLSKEKKQSFDYLFWECPDCKAKRYTDTDVKMNDDEQELTRECLECKAKFKIKRKKGYYEIEPK